MKKLKKILVVIVAIMMLASVVLVAACGNGNNNVAVTSVTIQSGDRTLYINTTDNLTLEAVVLPATATDGSVTWSSDDHAVATIGATTGTLELHTAGYANITATSVSTPSRSDTIRVTVSSDPIVAVTAVAIDGGARTISLDAIAAERQLTVTVTPTGATNPAVTWISSNESVATIAGGLLDLLTVGYTDITATSACTPSVYDTVRITVSDEPGVPVASIDIVGGDRSIAIGAEAAARHIQFTVGPDDATNKNVTWTSSDEDVAMVINSTSAGVTTGYLTLLSLGYTYITATSVSTPSVYATIRVDVTPDAGTVTGIAIEGGDIYLEPGADALSRRVFFDIIPAYAPERAVTWTSTNEAVATIAVVPNFGGRQNGMITLTGTLGYTYLTVRSNSNPLAYDTVRLTVAITPVESIAITGGDRTIATNAGVTARDILFTVTPENATNRTVTWTSSDPAVATITAAGRLNLLSVGTTTITARSNCNQEAFDTIVVTVVLPPVESIVLGGTIVTASLFDDQIGTTHLVTALVNPFQAEDRTVTWTSDNHDVATVNPTGGADNEVEITAHGTGDALITATSNGNPAVTASFTFSVGFRQHVRISSPQEFLMMGSMLATPGQGYSFYLANDLDFTSVPIFTSPGTLGVGRGSGDPNNPANVALRGTFDGRGHVVRNLQFQTGYYGGLFNAVLGGTIRNVTFDNIRSHWGTDSGMGGLIMGQGLATIENVFISGGFTRGAAGSWWHGNGLVAGILLPGSVVRNVIVEPLLPTSAQTTGVVFMNHAETFENIYVITDGFTPPTAAEFSAPLARYFGRNPGYSGNLHHPTYHPTPVNFNSFPRAHIEITDPLDPDYIDFTPLGPAWNLNPGALPNFITFPPAQITISAPESGFLAIHPLVSVPNANFGFRIVVDSAFMGTPVVTYSVQGGVQNQTLEYSTQTTAADGTRTFNFIIPADHVLDGAAIDISSISGIGMATNVTFTSQDGVEIFVNEDRDPPVASLGIYPVQQFEDEDGYAVFYALIGGQFDLHAGSVITTDVTIAGTTTTISGDLDLETRMIRFAVPPALFEDIEQTLAVGAIDGLGAPLDHIVIRTPQQFIDIFATPATRALSYVLANDIDFAGFGEAAAGDNGIINWGAGTRATVTFTGSFDGRGFAIRNFTLTSSYAANDGGQTGLFPHVAAGATVRNLALIGFDAMGGGQSGILARTISGTVENIYLEGNANLAFAPWGVWGNNGLLAGTITATANVTNVVANVERTDAVANIANEAAAAATFANVFIVYTGDSVYDSFNPYALGAGVYGLAPVDSGTTAGVTVSTTNTGMDFAALHSCYWAPPAAAGDFPTLIQNPTCTCYVAVTVPLASELTHLRLDGAGAVTYQVWNYPALTRSAWTALGTSGATTVFNGGTFRFGVRVPTGAANAFNATNGAGVRVEFTIDGVAGYVESTLLAMEDSDRTVLIAIPNVTGPLVITSITRLPAA